MLIIWDTLMEWSILMILSMIMLVGENGAIIAGKRPCWRCSSGFGKKVNFLLALVPSIDCPKAHNKTRCSGIWLHQQRPQQWSGSSLLLDWYWTRGEASWTHLGLITSSSYVKLSCWEHASLSGSKQHTSSLGTSCDCAQSTSNKWCVSNCSLFGNHGL